MNPPEDLVQQARLRADARNVLRDWYEERGVIIDDDVARVLCGADTVDVDDVDPAPWSRLSWHGHLVSIDGCPAHDFAESDVDMVIAWRSTGDYWDGDTAGIAILTDGRFIAWEANYGPTGNGFCEDAYGGEADILFGASAYACWSHLSQRAQELLTSAPPRTR